jgi:rhodanese-related sulfurtransferase
MTAGQLAQRQQGPAAPLVIDLRGAVEYEAGHVAGAINVPFEILGRWAADQKLAQKKQTVVMYCACTAEHSAAVGCILLRNQGFAETWALQGGWTEWQQARKPWRAGKNP